ncbi:MAG: 50S ribosomal protein L11 methyltransferase [Clostridia bacterium]
MYKEIIVNTTAEGADYVAAAFFAIGVSGVKFDDPNVIQDVLKSDIRWDYINNDLFKRLDRETKISAFVSQTELNSKLEELKAELDKLSGIDMGSLKIEVQDYRPVDWLSNWKEHYKGIEAGRFVVLPEWEDYKNQEGKIEIKIDPSMAFGTGEHESTRLCLELMSHIDFNKKSVLDIGTGSGVLGIAAAKAGASDIYMCDIDSVAVQAAKENAVLNGVQALVKIEKGDLVENTVEKSDIVLANLTGDILIRLATLIPSNIKEGGKLIASGIIHEKKQAVITAFEEKAFTLLQAPAMGEWNALMFSKD